MDSNDIFKPFDHAYSIVTISMKDAASLQSASIKSWMEYLIPNFKKERDKWDRKSRLVEYIKLSERLGYRYLRFAAGTYLHIGYDLPRVMANSINEPQFTSKKSILRDMYYFEFYMGLGDLFPKLTRDIASSSISMGKFSRLHMFASLFGLFNVPDMWMRSQRRAAWHNADILSDQTYEERELTEPRMALAMTKALSHVQRLNPWAVSKMVEPIAHYRFTVDALTVIFALMSGLVSTIEIAASIAIISSAAVIAVLALNIRAYRRSSDFISELSYRTDLYVSKAIQDPEGFDSFIEAKERELPRL